MVNPYVIQFTHKPKAKTFDERYDVIAIRKLEVTKEMLSGVNGVSTRTYHRRCQDAFGKDLGVAKSLAGIMFHSIKSMELVCQMAHDDKVMNDYTFDMIVGLKSSKQSRNRMVKRMLRKHPVRALRMIV